MIIALRVVWWRCLLIEMSGNFYVSFRWGLTDVYVVWGLLLQAWVWRRGHHQILWESVLCGDPEKLLGDAFTNVLWYFFEPLPTPVTHVQRLKCLLHLHLCLTDSSREHNRCSRYNTWCTPHPTWCSETRSIQIAFASDNWRMNLSLPWPRLLLLVSL